MFNLDAVPYFPLKFLANGEGWVINNPLTNKEHELNQAAYWLLRLCDGYHTWQEVTSELSRVYGISPSAVTHSAALLLQTLTEDGVLWWRQQRMQWWKLPPPTYVLWDLTGRCNLRCRHCVVGAGSSKTAQLSLEECYHVVDELATSGVSQVILSGGEPLMRRDFFDIAEYAVGKHLTLQVATNGSLISESVAQRLARIGAYAQVSLDGATPEIHDDFRQVAGTWHHTVQGIRCLVQAGVPVMVATVVTKANLQQIPALYQLAADLGAHTFRILPFVPFGRGLTASELEVSPQEMRSVTAHLHQRRAEQGLSIAPMEFECTLAPAPAERASPHTRIGCDGAVEYCTITTAGEVLPCNFFAGVEAENIKEHSFAWIWANSRFLNYFRSLTIADICGVCQGCSWLSACRGSCIAANFAHGDIFQSNCHCWLVDSVQKINTVHLGSTEEIRG